MATKANIIKVYAQADSAKKVDIIIRYYPNFMGIVESYTDGLRYMIENEKAFNRQANRGELGVRVQAKGNHSDITGNTFTGRKNSSPLSRHSFFDERPPPRSMTCMCGW